MTAPADGVFREACPHCETIFSVEERGKQRCESCGWPKVRSDGKITVSMTEERCPECKAQLFDAEVSDNQCYLCAATLRKADNESVSRKNPSRPRRKAAP